MAKPCRQSDFNIFKSLWSRINDAVIRPPIPGDPARDFLLMEMPGYSINPDVFDEDKFYENPNAMSPAYATALLVDKVPAFAPYFYDTGSHISFYWKQLVETFVIVDKSKVNQELKAKYDYAIEMLYGDLNGYKNQRKTELFKKLDTLRTEWHKAREELEKFRKKCQRKPDWPENFEPRVKPYVDRVDDTFTEYDNVQSQIEQYQAAIFQYTRGDLSILLLHQRQAMGQRTLYEAGRHGAATPFYQTFLEPADWWKWFKGDEPEENEGWMQIEVKQDDLYESENDAFSQLVTDQSHVDPNFGGLFAFREQGKSGSVKAQDTLTCENTNLKLSFQLHKVAIDRPWMDMDLLKYTNIGIRGLKAGSWSNGKRNVIDNDGQFPLLPTHFLVARNVEISASKDDMRLATVFKSAIEATEDKMSGLGSVMSIGCFTVKGNFGSGEHSQGSSCEYVPTTNTLKIKGALIIGWVCTVVPKFPTVSMDHQNESVLGGGES